MVAEIEKLSRGSVDSKCLTKVVFPAPEGAVKNMILPDIIVLMGVG